MRSENSVYRREAALAFGSVQDSAASLMLGSALLEDSDIEVQKNAAFALGQTGGTQAVNALIPALHNKDKYVLREVLQALGKTIKKNDFNVLMNFQSNDSISQEGLAFAYYYLRLRGISDSTITRKTALFLANKYSYMTRMAAAFYFVRPPKILEKGFEEKLIVAAQHDKSPDVRMAAVNGFRHLEPTEAVYILKEVMHTEKDPRVRVNAMKACTSFSFAEGQEVLFLGLNDSIEMVQVVASEIIRAKSGDAKRDIKPKKIADQLTVSKSTRVKANLFGAWLNAFPKEDKTGEIIKIYASAPVYYRSLLLSALGETKSPAEQKAFDFISTELFNPKSEKVILSTAASAMASINKNSETKILSKKFLEVYKKAITQNTDVAVTGIFAEVLMNPNLKYKEEIKNLTFLYDAMAKLSLPKDIESLQPLENAVAYLEGKEKPVPLKNEFNHPIDWNLVKTIPTNHSVTIKTAKGDIVLNLLVEDDPGSVANFVSLVNRGYYNGKFFHRVVPNFVIQTGCNRGDGYGSENYSIRSEFTMKKYTTGSVGMASAGKDTEGTQWFITHSPTLHLDGKYSLFAQTIRGMDIIDKIEVGDIIIKVSLPQKEE